jgi:FtsP/CotA-like multicopper oxidase with cupredoxin domain
MKASETTSGTHQSETERRTEQETGKEHMKDIYGLSSQVGQGAARVELRDGDVFDLHVGPVKKRIGVDTVEMLAYNGSIPGPTLRVRKGAAVTVRVANGLPMETTVHWHGLRVENRFDGTPHATQAPIAPGGTFDYQLRFPDEGVYWYHPHMREDYAQEMGLYGAIVVTSDDPDYWPQAHRELVVMVDDLLLENGEIAPFGGDNMGRFGNMMLLNGESDWTAEVRRGEVVRLHLINVANVRNFRLGIPNARIKLVGGDLGLVEREELVEEILLAPGERVSVDVLFAESGSHPIEQRSTRGTTVLGEMVVVEQPAEPSLEGAFATLRSNSEMEALRGALSAALERAPDKTIVLQGDVPGMARAGAHPHDSHGMDHDMAHMDHEAMHAAHSASGMGEVVWKLVDQETDAVNDEIDWSFVEGESVKVRLMNDPTTDHPMGHPFHVHGQRFLVLSRDGVPNANLVWKDTVYVEEGETVDVLIEMSNPGIWMAHCHISEHAEAGMMFNFRVS